MKRIEWLCPIPDCSIEDLRKSNLASIRLRTAVSAQAAKASGCRIAFSDGQRRAPADLVIVGKIDFISDILRPKRWLEHLHITRQKKTPIVIDYTDNHLAVDNPAARFYKEALNLADTIVCSSQTLADHLADHTSCERIVIEDPIEVSIKAPFDRQNDSLTALWFGHASNLRYLIDYLRDEFRVDKSTRLILVTNAYPLPQELADQLNCPELDSVEVNVVPWSLDDMVAAAAISDVCLLPAGVDDPRKNGASSNRLLTALALGLPVAADLLPSYLPFRSYFLDLRSKELKCLLNDPTQYFKGVEKAQALIRSKYTKTRIASNWVAVLGA